MSSKTNFRCPHTSENDLFTVNSNIIHHKSTTTATTHGNSVSLLMVLKMISCTFNDFLQNGCLWPKTFPIGTFWLDGLCILIHPMLQKANFPWPKFVPTSLKIVQLVYKVGKNFHFGHRKCNFWKWGKENCDRILRGSICKWYNDLSATNTAGFGLAPPSFTKWR